MPVTTPPLITHTRSSPTALKLVEASGLQLPAQPAAKLQAAVIPEPVPTEKVSLRSNQQQLNEAEQAEISSLKALDSRMHQHEQAHLSASSGLNVSRAAFTYQRGPDGVQYAVGGDVSIDTSPGRTAEDSLARAAMIIDVALAPADPSPSDRSAAAKGQNMAQQAQAELLQQAQQPAQQVAPAKNAVVSAYTSSALLSNKIDTFA